MADTEAAAENTAPITVHAQYLKDLSFENPNAPDSLRLASQNPDIAVKVDVSARQLDEQQPVFEVNLEIKCEAKSKDAPIFVCEMTYAGVFTVKVDASVIRQVVMIECPKLLFPFARTILSDAIRDGGFPPLMLQPVNFEQLYNQSLAGQQNAGTA